MKKEPMIRKQLYIEPAQDVYVKELAAEYGMSEAQIVRTAIDALSKGRQFTTENLDLECWEEEAQFIRSRFHLQTKDGNTRRWTRAEIYER